MSYKKRHLLYLFYCISSVLVLSGCKKVETTRTYMVTDTTAQNSTATDEVTVNLEFDHAIDDAITILSNHNATIAGAFLDSVSPNIFVITYDVGKQPDKTKIRSGNDSIHLNSIPWVNPGSTATVAFGDIGASFYEVTYSNATTVLTLTGNATITNVYGGLLQNLTPSDSLVVHIRATINFTYNDANSSGVQYYTWHLNELRTFTLHDTVMNAIVRADTSVTGYSNIASWGTTRLGSSFYTSITTPIIQNISSTALEYNPLSGAKTIEGISEPITLTYGVNSAGVSQASATPYGFYISWTDNGVQGTSVLPYYY